MFYEIGPAEDFAIINKFSLIKATGPDADPIRAPRENNLVFVSILAH